MSAGGTYGPQSAAAIYNQIHETAAKRIRTLDYLRKVLVLSVYYCPAISPQISHPPLFYPA